MKYGCLSMIEPVKHILLKHPKDAFLSQDNLLKNWKAYHYLSCPDYDQAISEFEMLASIIEKEVGSIKYLPPDDAVGLDSIYTHDSVKITPQGAIYFPMGKQLRKSEASVMRVYLENLDIPTLGAIEGEGKMEGGDVLWIDRETVAVGVGYRTNQEGIRQFRSLVGNFINNIIEVPLPNADGPDACLHLMSLVSFVDRNLAVVYSRYLPVFFRNFLIDRGFKLLEVSDLEYEKLGSNVLALSPGVCIMIEGNPEIENKLKSEGLTVYTYPGQNLSYYGTGGPTCLTQPIFRSPN